MALKNIELFDTFTGVILKELYENFPVCLDIKVDQMVADNNEGLENVERDRKELILSETLFWLQDSEFITFKAPDGKMFTYDGHQRSNFFMCCVLTAKGLEVLKKIPKRLDSSKQKSIGEELIEAVKAGAKKQISDVVGAALSQII